MITQNTKRASVSTRWSWPCLSPRHHPSLFLISLPMVSARWTICMQVQAFCHLNDLIPHSLCLEEFSLLLSDVPFKYRIKYYPFWKTSLVPQAMKVILSLCLQRLLHAQEFLQCSLQLTCVSLKANICWESAHVPGIPHKKNNQIELMSTKLQRDGQVTNLDYGQCKIHSEHREVICCLILSPGGLVKASRSSYHLVWVFKIK